MAASASPSAPSNPPKRASYNLTDAHAAILSPGTGNIFGEEADVRMPEPNTDVSTSATDVRTGGQGARTAAPDASLRSRAPPYQPTPQGTRWAAAEEIEMRQQPQQPR